MVPFDMRTAPSPRSTSASWSRTSMTLAAVGVYFSRRQTSLDEFFLARRSMGWLPVGLSLMAALNSGIEYLMQPSATIRSGSSSRRLDVLDSSCIPGCRA